MKNHDLIGILHLIHQVSSPQDTQTVLLHQAPDVILYVLSRSHIQTDRGFVKQEKGRPMNKSPGDLDPAGLTTGKNS